MTNTNPDIKPSALLSPPWWYKRLADPAGTDSEGPESGLQALLEQLQLAELREIARQRGWRVKGSRKADYVAALTPLLDDPTEVARAVTSLPDGLREALRAALVAEDGRGITPALLAQTITALHTGRGSPLKPVEAAGLLCDLTRWGLLIPWRDPLGGILHYLFPWEIQRNIPPLPGWCRQSPQAPYAPVLFKDKSAFAQLLYTVWECISQQPQRLRPAPQPSIEERPTLAMRGYARLTVRDWPYDPQEIHDCRRTDTKPQSLSVPTPTFLLDDAGVSALASLADGNPEQLEFVCRVLCDLDLVSTEKGYLVARPEVMARFLRCSTTEQYTLLVQSYLSLLDWNELDVLLRMDTRLMLRRDAFYVLPHREFRSHLLRLRHILLRFLSTAGEEGWCTLEDIELALRNLWPDFFSTLIVEGQHWPTPNWWLAWRADQRKLQPKDTRDWSAAQSRLLHIMLEGPLYWLGLAELCHHNGELSAFRLRGLSDRVWDRPLRTTQESPTEPSVVVDESNLSVTVHPGVASPQVYTFLGRIARLEESAPGRFVYRLDMRVVHASFERGESLTDLFLAWQEIMPLPMPEAIQQALSTWWAHYGQVRLYEGFALLELDDEVTLRELEASTSLKKHVIARLSPRLVLVRDEAVPALLQEFVTRGYTPRETR